MSSYAKPSGIRVARHPSLRSRPESALPDAPRCEAVRGGKSVSCRTPAVVKPIRNPSCRASAERGPSGIRLVGHPLTAEPSKVRLFGLVRAWGSVRVTLRVLMADGCAQNPDRVAQNPDGDVRQDIGLLVARDTGAQSAGVTGLRSLSACGVRSRTPIYRSGWCASVLSHSFRRPGVVSLQNFFPISSSEKLPPFFYGIGSVLGHAQSGAVDCRG